MILIQGGFLVDPKSGTEGEYDVLIDGEHIAKISEHIEATENMQVIPAYGCLVAPGLVDTHSHFRDPGFTEKEDIHTGSLAAAKGGYTSILMMANTKPTIDTVETLQEVLEKGKKEKIHIYSAANVTSGMQGDARTDMVSLAAAGARVFTDDGKPITDPYLLEDAMKLAKKLHIPISLHEEDPAFIAQPGVNGGGEAAKTLNLGGADRKAEITMIERDLKLAEKTGVTLCIQHISTAEGVALVREAKKTNPNIHAEATPQHFTLTEDAVISQGTLAKVNPPLRTEADRMAIIEGIIDGTIDVIATDHAPHTRKEKEQEFTKAPSGMIGLETALSLGIRELVMYGYISIEKLLALMTYQPAQLYGLPAGDLHEGGPADVVIFELDRTWTVPETFASKASNSPFIGEVVPGIVRYTIAGGEIAYELKEV